MALNYFLGVKLTFLVKQVEESCDCDAHPTPVFKEITRFEFENKNPVSPPLNRCCSDFSVMRGCCGPELVSLTFLKGKKSFFNKEVESELLCDNIITDIKA